MRYQHKEKSKKDTSEDPQNGKSTDITKGTIENMGTGIAGESKDLLPVLGYKLTLESQANAISKEEDYASSLKGSSKN